MGNYIPKYNKCTETSYVYMPSMNLTVAPTAFVVLAKETIEKYPFHTKFFFLNILRVIVMESIRKKPRKAYRRLYTILLKVSDALRYVAGTLDCLTTWSRFVHPSFSLH